MIATALGALPLAASAQADYGSADTDTDATMSAPSTTSTDISALTVPAQNVHMMPVAAGDVPLDATFVDGDTLAQATVIALPRDGSAPQASTLADYLNEHGIDPNAVVAVAVDTGDYAMPSQVADVTVYYLNDMGDTSSS